MAGLEELSPETKAALDDAEFIIEVDTKRHPDWIELPDGTRYLEERTTTAHVAEPIMSVLVCDSCGYSSPMMWTFCPGCGARRVTR